MRHVFFFLVSSPPPHTNNLLVRCFRSNFQKRVAWSSTAAALLLAFPPAAATLPCLPSASSTNFRKPPPPPALLSTTRQTVVSHLAFVARCNAEGEQKNHPVAQIFDPFIFFVDLYSPLRMWFLFSSLPPPFATFYSSSFLRAFFAAVPLLLAITSYLNVYIVNFLHNFRGSFLDRGVVLSLIHLYYMYNN